MDRRLHGGPWLNPSFSKSVSASSTSTVRHRSSSRSISPPWITRSEPSTVTPSLSIYSTMKNYISCWPSKNDKRKKVVMDSEFVGNRDSLIGFLKGMGLEPKLSLVNGETVIAVDVSQIRDKRMKTKLLNLTKKIVVAGVKSNSSASNKNSTDSDCQNKTHIVNSSSMSVANRPSPAITEPANRSRPESRIELNMSKSWPLNQSHCNTKNSYNISLHKVTKSNENYSYTSEVASLSISSTQEQLNESTQMGIRENDCETPEVEFSNEVTIEQSVCDSRDTVQPAISEALKKKRKIFKRLRHWLFGRKSKGKEKSSLSSVAIDKSKLVGKGSADSSICCESVFKEENKPSVQVDEKVSAKSPEASSNSPLCVNSSKILNQRDNQRSSVQNAIKGTVRSWERLNSSISLPAVKSPRSILNRLKFDEIKGSKSVEKVESSEGDIDQFRVVDQDAAIGFKRNRMTLEGGDAKYASILHNDKDFDSHFACLEDSKFSDIENQVDKVKKRIMFARAMAALSNKLPKNAPKIDLSELLWPSGDGENGDQIDAATKSSFYQKFVASMNIMRCTNRFDVCDRSVMTDEPLSTMYRDFITSPVLNRRKNVRRNRRNVRTSRRNESFSKHENVTKNLGWLEPIVNAFKGSRDDQNRNKSGSGEENWLSGLLDKLVVARSNKKGYVKTQ